jgi:RNase P/RNase MRP subunit p30
MEEYVFPPSFDFVNFPNVVKPIAMYIFEFTHTLTKDDLSHIWQNLPPDIGASFEEAEATVQHELLSGEILKPNDMQNLKFMIFKVKQRAEINYFNKVINKNANADERYDFGVSIGRRQKEKYSYNWPYDFFSLVEFVKMDSEITFTSKKRRDE